MLIIFDWDGTLCDSVEHIVEAMQRAAGECSLAPPAAIGVRDIVGLGLPQAIDALFPGLAPESGQALAAAYSRHFGEIARGGARLFAGAMETLLGLRARGFELAVATGKSRRGLERVLAELDMSDFFETVRCADETRSKPHPQMLLEILAERRRPPLEALMVGDTEYDLAMARDAGVRSVGVSHGVHDVSRLARHGPVAIIDELPALLELDLLQGGD